MNYNRRSTRPDSLFYRDQRKLGLSRRARRRTINAAFIVAAAVVALIAWYLLHR